MSLLPPRADLPSKAPSSLFHLLQSYSMCNYNHVSIDRQEFINILVVVASEGVAPMLLNV